MRVLVTGGTGGIGSEIVKKFRSHGHTVYAPTRQELDLATDFILLDNKFDIIINNAGINPLKQIHEFKCVSGKLYCTAKNHFPMH